MSKQLKITITESITEEHIDSVLLDHLNEDIEFILIGDGNVKDKLIELSNKYGMKYEFY